MSVIDFNIHKNIGLLTVNRPEVRNDFNIQAVERAEFPKLWAAEVHLKVMAEFINRTVSETKSEAES